MMVKFIKTSELIDKYQRGDCDFQYMGMEAANLDNIDLSGADLRNAKFYGCVVRQANLSGVNLTGASIHRCKFNGTNLSGANLSNTWLEKVNLSDVTGIGTIFKEARLSDSNLQQANFTASDFSDANFDKVKLVGVNFTQCKLSIVYVKNTDLNEAILTDAIVKIRKGYRSSYCVCIKCGGDAYHACTTFTGGAFGSGNTDADLDFSCYDCGYSWCESK